MLHGQKDSCRRTRWLVLLGSLPSSRLRLGSGLSARFSLLGWLNLSIQASTHPGIHPPPTCEHERNTLEIYNGLSASSILFALKSRHGLAHCLAGYIAELQPANPIIADRLDKCFVNFEHSCGDFALKLLWCLSCLCTRLTGSLTRVRSSEKGKKDRQTECYLKCMCCSCYCSRKAKRLN